MPIRPLLTRQQELDLIEKAQNGDSEAENSLLWHNEGFINIVVRQLTCGLLRTNDIDDYLQEGRLGYLEAIRDFDIKKKCKLSTYAYWKIRKRVARYSENFSRTVRIPSNILQKISSVFRKSRKKNREPEQKDFKKALRRTKKVFDINIVLNLYHGCSSLTYDHMAVHYDKKYYDFGRLQECIKKDSGVKQRNLDIVYKFFGVFGYDEKTTKELSEEYGVSLTAINTTVRESVAKIGALMRLKRIELRDLFD